MGLTVKQWNYATLARQPVAAKMEKKEKKTSVMLLCAPNRVKSRTEDVNTQTLREEKKHKE